MAASTALSPLTSLTSGFSGSDLSNIDSVPLTVSATATSVSTPVSDTSTPIATSASAASPPAAPTPTAPLKIEIRPAAPALSTGSQPVNKMAMSSVISPQASPPKLSMTTKEWVIPPRPKPGRKPATDTPPTKRKAQNRAAQRAFRERRAARVGELEEQIDEQREEHEKVEKQLKDRIHGLEMEVQTFRTRCVMLESLLERERQERARLAGELETMRRKWPDDSSGMHLRTASLPGISPSHYDASQIQTATSRQPPQQHLSESRASISNTRFEPKQTSQAFSISQIISPPDPPDMDTSGPLGCGSCGPNGQCACIEEVLNAPVGCGNCTVGSRCECLENGIGGLMESSSSDLKRPHPTASPSIAPDEKRLRSDHRPTETDFTALFAKKPNPTVAQASFLPPISQPAGPPRDPCGFCEDGTYCVCAEESAASATIPPLIAPIPATNSAPRAPLSTSSQTRTPPPSETDAVPPPMEVTSTGAIKLPSFSNLAKRKPASAVIKQSSGCGSGGPGTCAQCLADPKSGLFCRSLAANFERQSGVSFGGCCGGSARGGGCCKSQGQQQQKIGLSLSCADAYKTLSSHQSFDQASDDIGSWLPQLRAAPTKGAEGRPPIEVEAASIMSVLKGFDIRFVRGN